MVSSSCTLFASAAQTSDPVEFIVTEDTIIFVSDNVNAAQVDYLKESSTDVAEVNIMPRYKFISSCGLTFTPKGTKVTVTAYTNYYSDIATSAYAEATLERYVDGSWSFYRMWRDTSYDDFPAVAGTTLTVPAGRYRCSSLHTATDGTYTDSQVIDGGEKNIG